MIEIPIQGSLYAVGHNGTNFLVINRTLLLGITGSALIDYNLVRIFNDLNSFSTGKVIAHKPDEKGQAFSCDKRNHFIINKENKYEIFRGKLYTEYSYEHLIKDTKSLITTNYLFTVGSTNKSIGKLLKFFFNANLPNGIDNRYLIVYNKENNKVETVYFDYQIVSLAINPEETILCVGCQNRIFFMDI